MEIAPHSGAEPAYSARYDPVLLDEAGLGTGANLWENR